MEQPTIYDIAREAGVSAATVSRVINNYPYVKKATRDKVLKFLASSNYVPNETARNLVTQSTRMVGILIADMRTTHHTEGVYYVEQELSKKGYTSLIYNTSSDPDRQAECIQQLSKRKTDAVVLMGSIYQNDKVKAAIEAYIPSVPVVICNGWLEGENIYGVVIDENSGVRDCVRFLAQEKGRKHLAFITNTVTPSNACKYQGFLEGTRIQNLEEGLFVDTGSSSTEVVAEAVRKVFVEHPETDGVIFSEDYVALIGLHQMQKMGLRIPEDVSVIGINNSRYSEISTPSLTSLDNMLFDSSLIAVRNLLQVLSGEHVTNKIILSTRIIQRSST